MGKLIYSYYVMDIIHRGHINQMKHAKTIAGEDGLSIVGILTDEAVMERKPRPILSFEERMDIASIVKYNDIVVPQDTYSPMPNVIAIKPDVLMESTSHKPEDIEKHREIMKSWGGIVLVMPYYPTTSSSFIKKKIKEEIKETK